MLCLNDNNCCLAPDTNKKKTLINFVFLQQQQVSLFPLREECTVKFQYLQQQQQIISVSNVNAKPVRKVVIPDKLFVFVIRVDVFYKFCQRVCTNHLETNSIIKTNCITHQAVMARRKKKKYCFAANLQQDWRV